MNPQRTFSECRILRGPPGHFFLLNDNARVTELTLNGMKEARATELFPPNMEEIVQELPVYCTVLSDKFSFDFHYLYRHGLFSIVGACRIRRGRGRFLRLNYIAEVVYVLQQRVACIITF
jgi:hypothetical protein